METRSQPARQERGHRGHELDAQLNFAQPMSRALALEALRPWGAEPELYGQGDEIRAARLTGALDPALVTELLRAGLEGGLYRSAELGRRGFLRSGTGFTEWMPWRRNVVVPRTQLERVELKEGLRYLVE
ncbi:hypothetical protein [Deinococcus ruber]|uniref:Uncharacterized protein n=1 Tax=Deinococcus ruber TaxID=1848197 RepID=A0A918BZ27_9DEIO|nr:hypothetical protein [Deinococcus ruber]GGQ99078.1 hypothetical protein GCM10008957_09550 [Deinococcus ruber]